MSPSGAILMEGHCANLANVMIGDRVVLHSGSLADPEFERENGIGDFLDHARAVRVVANSMEINADGPADVCLEDVAQLAIHNSPHLTTFVSANASAELFNWLPS